MAVYGAFNQGSSPLRLAVRKRPAPTVQRKGSVYMHALLYLRVHVPPCLYLCVHAKRRATERWCNREKERRSKGWRTRGLNISGGLSGLCWLGIAPTREWPLYTHTSERQTATRTWNTVWNSRLCGQDRGSTEQTFSFLHFLLVGCILFLRRVSMPCLCMQDRMFVLSSFVYEGKRSNVSHSVSRPIYAESPFLFRRVDRIRLRSKGGRSEHLETRTICLRFV